MRFAYADPPYTAKAAKKWYGDDPRACAVNYEILIGTLEAECPDGWALSTATTMLREVLPLCPKRHRVMAWVKPYSFSPPCIPRFAWEPVILMGGRTAATGRVRGPVGVKDWISVNPNGVSSVGRDANALRGAKPAGFCEWLFDCLGVLPGDEFWDVFPGSDAVSRCFSAYVREAAGYTGLPLLARVDGT